MKIPSKQTLQVKDLPSISLGTSTFQVLRSQHQIFIDKTDLLHELLRRGNRYFFTRPRGFGKTLLISILAAYFNRKEELFEELEIAKGGLYTGSARVVTLDFAEISNFQNDADFTAQLHSFIASNFASIGFDYGKNSHLDIWQQFSRWNSGQDKQSLVFLIDNCDAPFAACLTKILCRNTVVEEITRFFRIVHENRDAIEFVWVSGNSNVGRRWILKACSELRDISLTPEASFILGFTKDEVSRNQYLMARLEKVLEVVAENGQNPIETLIRHYGGYNFNGSGWSPVIDPWSFLHFLKDGDISFPSYRPLAFPFPSWLEKFALSQSLEDLPNGNQTAELFDFQLTNAFDHERFSEISLLTQLGFLTIKSHSEARVAVGYPNLSAEKFLLELKKKQLVNMRD